ncbi:MAG TPA: SBBP repeat-containing protein [Bryobacteraceae bacterium]|nr:SBBP repeat-containing protein [Bryobacteraceae bacterium]
MTMRSIPLALLAALVLQTAVTRAEHPVVAYSQRLPDPPMFVSGLAVDHSGSAYLVRGNDYGGGAYLSKVDGSGHLWTVRIGGALSEQFGSYLDSASAVATDMSGNVYLVGNTRSPDFPTVNAIQARMGGGWDAFLTKLDPEGKILFSTYLGGSGDDFAAGVAVDHAGNVYVTGSTGSADFLAPAVIQTSLRGRRDAFLVKITSAGRLAYSTYLGGSGDGDSGRGIAVDPSGNVYLTGETDSLDFPTANPIQSSAGGGGCGTGGYHYPCTDAFAAKLSGEGALIYSTYLGGSLGDYGRAIAADASGNAYVAGITESSDFPLQNALQSVFQGGKCDAGLPCNADAFITKLDPSGQLLYSTFLGGSGQETVTGVAVDGSGRVIVAGGTLSSDFPLAGPFSSTYSASCSASPPAFYTAEVCQDAFLTQLNPEGSALLFSTFLDCVSCDANLGISLDASGNLFLAGGGGIDIVTPQFLAKLDFSAKPSFAAGGIVNAASFLPGAIAPGEMIEISGAGMGPILEANLPWDQNVPRMSLGATRLLFDGIPAPLIHVDANRIRAVVPYAVAGNRSTRLVVDSAGVLSDPVDVPVVDAAPGIFTWNLYFGIPGMGLDRAFVYNEDGNQNTPQNPASRSSVIVFFATGVGQTDPAGVDGQLTGDMLPKPLLPVSVRIGGQGAEVLSAGGAPGVVSGLIELHVRVPADAPTGDALPIELTVGGAGSQPGLAVSVK